MTSWTPTPMTSSGSDDRGVSQMVGFILIFGILITSVGIVSTVGFDQLDAIRDHEQDRNAERAVDLLGQNFDEIQQGQTTVRAGEFDLNDGSLGTLPASDSAIIASVESSGTPGADYEERIPLNALVYEFDDTRLAYEGGAVLRQDQGGTILLDSPSFACTDNRALVSVVTVDTESQRQIGDGTVTTRLQKNVSSIRFPLNRTGENSTEGTATVSVEIDSEFEQGWSRHLDENTEWEPVGGMPTNEFVCDAGPSGADVDEYRVVQTRINLTYVR